MNEKTIAAIALSNRDFPSLEAKLAEAVQWVELAAAQGADLAVLPEAINFYKGDGAGNTNRPPLAEVAREDWPAQVASLIDAAARCRIALAIPLVTRNAGHYTNSFFLFSREGTQIGQYQKLRPTPEELAQGVRPGRPKLLEWEGLTIGGAICFDTCFPDVFAQQAAAGADLFLVPSLWPGGSQLNYFALHHSTPIVLAYPAWSRIIDIDGKAVAEGGYRNETLRFGFGAPVVVATINFDRVALYGNHNQEKMVEVQRTYGTRVRVQFDQPNCLWFLESRSADLTVREVMDRFGLISKADYFQRCEQEYGRAETDEPALAGAT